MFTCLCLELFGVLFRMLQLGMFKFNVFGYRLQGAYEVGLLGRARMLRFRVARSGSRV